MPLPRTPVADFVETLGDATREQVLEACPFPALLLVARPPGAAPLPAVPRDDEAAAAEGLRARFQALRQELGRAWLVFLQPGRPGGGVTLGRSPEVDVQLEDPSISRLHAELLARGTTWHLTDLTSAHGTSVEGRRVPPGRSLPLASGYALAFGDVTAVFLLPRDLHGLLHAAREGATRVVVPPEGCRLRDLLELARSPHAPNDASPPLLLQVPTRDDEQPALELDRTQRLSDSVVQGVERDAAADRAWIHSIAPRWGEGRPVVVGRAAEADVVLTEASVSKAHCQLSFNGRLWRVMDLESQNGTWLRGARLPPGVLTHIEQGDSLWLGRYRCVFLLPAAVRGLLARLRRRLASEGGAAGSAVRGISLLVATSDAALGPRLASTLEVGGVSARWVATLRALGEALRERRRAVVLVHGQLRDGDALELLARPGAPPVVLLAADAHAAERAVERLAGSRVAVVLAPFDAERVRTKVGELLAPPTTAGRLAVHPRAAPAARATAPIRRPG